MRESSRSLWLALVFFIGMIYMVDVKGIKFYLVPSDSMRPTLKKSDYIAGFKVKHSDLKRGDIVVFSSAYNGDFFVKRVVGLPGETLALFNGFVFINSRRLEEPYVQHRGNENLDPVRIPEGRVFLMGDNRTNSLDSRWYGPVATGLLQSKVSFIYNPVSRIGPVR